MRQAEAAFEERWRVREAEVAHQRSARAQEVALLIGGLQAQVRHTHPLTMAQMRCRLRR